MISESVFHNVLTGDTFEILDGRPTLIEKERVLKCSHLQGRITLGEATCNALDALAEDPETPWAMREAIKNAVEWQRTSPTMDELGWLLGYTPEQMDTLFLQAMAISV